MKHSINTPKILFKDLQCGDIFKYMTSTHGCLFLKISSCQAFSISHNNILSLLDDNHVINLNYRLEIDIV